jgi:hypothetical protein
MITTILLDVGGTIFIKDEHGNGIINPAIKYLCTHIPKSIEMVLVSDTEVFDIPPLMQQFIPELENKKMFIKKDQPWIDKTKPKTYLKVCEVINKKAIECVLIDNEEIFRSAAESAGIKTYNVDMDSILQCLGNIQ